MPPKPSDRPLSAQLSLELGQRVRQLRLAQRLTQHLVAEQLNMTVQAYSRMERGLSLPSFPTLLRLCDALNTSADHLLGLQGGARPHTDDEHALALQNLTAHALLLEADAVKTLERVARQMLPPDARPLAEPLQD